MNPAVPRSKRPRRSRHPHGETACPDRPAPPSDSPFSPALASAPARPAAGRARAQNAVRVLTDIQAIPESAIPDKLFDEARAVIVIPDAMKLGLVVGGRRGHGLLSVKAADGTWSNPAFVPLTGGGHRPAGGRAVGGHRAGVPQRPRAGFHRQRQVHPRRRCRRRRRPGRAQRQRRHRRRDEGGNLVVVARAACSPASPSTARCSASTMPRTNRRTAATPRRG